MAVVFAVQNPHWKSYKTGQFEPKYDLSTAEEFGRIQFLLEPSTRLFDTDRIVNTLRDKMADYSEDDFVLLIGNPVLIALTAIEAAENVDELNFLQWDRHDKAYSPIKVDLEPTQRQGEIHGN